MKFVRRIEAAVAVSLLTASTMVAPGTSAGREATPAVPAGATDISDTAQGRQLIGEARRRFERMGYVAEAWRAVRDASGILIVPHDTRLEAYAVTVRNGREIPVLAPVTADDPAWVREQEAPVELAEASSAPAWQFVTNRCFSRISDTWAVLDHCYTKYKLGNDGSGTYDWYALSRYGTARNNSPWVLDKAVIRAYRYGGSWQSWADWSPRSDWEGGNCSTTSIGITSPVGGLSQQFERCPESVTFTKSSNGSQPDYTQTWFGMGTRGNREVKFEIAVRVGQGGSASWSMPASVRGSAY